MKNNRVGSYGIVILTAILQLTVAHAQNVGIGTASPASKLSVNGNMSLGDTTYTGTAAPANGAIIKGFVGIGTKVPVSPLNIVAEGSDGGTSDDIRLESYGSTHAPAFFHGDCRRNICGTSESG
jgi:hypothetical protein